MQKHKSGKRSTIRRHEEEQQARKSEHVHNSDQKVEPPGKGRPDPEEGVGTVQNQKR